MQKETNLILLSQCTSCSQLVIHPDQRFNFFSDYSQTVSCPQCGIQVRMVLMKSLSCLRSSVVPHQSCVTVKSDLLQDFHFSKPLEKTFLSKAELDELSRQSSASGRRDGMPREPPGLSWARVTAPCSS